jgi:type IV secretory pathway VirB2 component (pilin)
MKSSLILKEKNSKEQNTLPPTPKTRWTPACAIAATSAFLLCPQFALGSVESSLQAVQDKLVGTLLPLGAMCGLAVAGLSFVAGHPNARQHLFYAIVGAIVGFGAESIVSLIQSLIH